VPHENTFTRKAKAREIGVAVLCLLAGWYDQTNLHFWGQWAGRSIGFSIACLSFIFGKNVKS
jgi:hypothetical protein